MSGAVISSNVTTKFNRAISATTTVNANCYAIVTYNATFATFDGTNGIANFASGDYGLDNFVTRYFGAGQTIPTSFTTPLSFSGFIGAISANPKVTYSIMTGVEFINSP